MWYECSYNFNLNIIETVTHGVATLGEMIDMLQCIVKLCSQVKSANVLVDHSELDVSTLTMEQIQDLSIMTVSSKEILSKRKCAHIAVQDIQFGLVRSWEIMTEVNGGTDLSTNTFRSRTDAIKWIKNVA